MIGSIVIVTTEYGELEGREREGIASFLGDGTPPYDTETRKTMELNETCQVLDDPYAMQREAMTPPLSFDPRRG